jgi:hypothetical protein
LAQDAITDVVFNIFSIIFPLSQSPSFRIHTKYQTNKTNSRHIHEHMVARPPRRSPPLILRNRQLGQHRKRAHRPPNRRRRIPL